MKICKRISLILTCCAPLVPVLMQPAFSQVTLDRLLSTVNVKTHGKCSTIDIRLNRPASYLHHFPVGGGTDLAINIEPLGTTATQEGNPLSKEAASVAPGNAAGVSSVVYDPTGVSGPIIRVVFDRVTSYRVIMDENTRHLRIDTSKPADAAACLGQSSNQDVPQLESDTASKVGGPPVTNDAASALAQGKEQLAAKDYGRAAAFFTKAVSIGDGKVKQEAQEMLGLARERAGQLAHAKAEYQTYLKLYPNGPGAARVRSRLESVMAAIEGAAEKQFAENRAKTGLAPVDTAKPIVAEDQKGDGPQNIATDVPVPNEEAAGGLHSTGKGMMLRTQPSEPDPSAWTWEKNGSIAQYYYRNDNFRAADPNSKKLNLHETYQNEMLSSADAYLHGENDKYEIELRSSAYNETGFGTESDLRSSNIGTLYAEGRLKDPGLSARVGRQSKSTGGVFGRFDGAVLGWDIQKDLKLQVVGGSPVYSRAAKPFADDRYFYGASLDYTFPNENWAGSIYVIEQDIKKIVDRRAIGAELRYSGKNKSIYSAADYDVFYNELNNAYVTGSWNLREGTTVYGSVDFRRVPFLVTSNALMGQQETKLTSLVDIFGEDSVIQLATDRTASSKSANIGISQDLSKDWQINLDATVADYSGTPASGNVDEIPDPGIEYYLSAQLSGANVFKDNDSLTMGLRFSSSDSSNYYMADAYLRYPVTENFRVSPRLRVSLRDSKTTDQLQFLVMPSVATRYRLNKRWSFETEIGLRWEDIVTDLSDTRSLDVLATAGYRFEF